MGLLEPEHWQGRWIAANKHGAFSPLLRRSVNLKQSVRRARVYISGVGYYELSINGKRIGDRVLDPAPTYYRNDSSFSLKSRVLYSAYDVTTSLRAGENAIGIMLGNGWYSPPRDTDSPRWLTPYGDRPRLMFQMNIELTNGSKVSVVSDRSWTSSEGPIVYNDLVHGETYDATQEQAGWDQPDFDDSSWEDVALVEAPSDTLTTQLLPASRVMTTIEAVDKISPKAPHLSTSTLIYDFGQNFTGWTRLTARGPRGAKLTLRYASRLYSDDNTLDIRSNQTAKQTDTYILKGDGVETWEPRFTLHGFRYVEVSSSSREVSVKKLEGRLVHNALNPAGTFVSSDKLINRVHTNITRTLRSSLQGIPQDAAERPERVAWLGDTGFTAEDYIYNYDMRPFLEKWLNDIRDSQREDGSIPVVAPPRVRAEVNLYEVWPSWQSTYPELVWHVYRYYGARRVIEEHYTSVKKFVDLLLSLSQDFLIPNARLPVKLGDHMEPQKDGFSRYESHETPPELIDNAYFYYDVELLTQMAEVLQRSSDAVHYRKLANSIKAAFNDRFFDLGTRQYSKGSQASNALPLSLGLVPKQYISAVAANLIDNIAEHNCQLSTGAVGTNALVQTLTQHGAAEVMYRLATGTRYPSLGHQIELGATTVCESYECNAALSQNMKLLASMDKFFYRDLAGIEPENAGYGRVAIHPQPVMDLRRVNATQNTVRGTVSVEWTRDLAARSPSTRPLFELSVEIPAGMEATISIPRLGVSNQLITEGGRVVWRHNSYVSGVAGIIGAGVNPGSVAFRTGSGKYNFALGADTLKPAANSSTTQKSRVTSIVTREKCP
jgi:alpha-L-rhamnosidase